MASRPAPLAAIAITAGGYIRLRRQAAGLSQHAVAAACVSSEVGMPAALAAIAAAEEDREVFLPADLTRLLTAFKFQPAVYLGLSQGLAAPDICRGCGCTWDDACLDDRTGAGCAWVDSTRSFCTVCRRKSL